MILKIISGGQTGIDKMGLEVATELKIETGGCAPKGFITENGTDYTLKNMYGLREVTDVETAEFAKKTGKSDRYTARTYINARDSDGTVYFSSDNNSPGSKTTRNGCNMFSKPFIMNPNIDTLVDFINKHKISVLNVAGNRGSKLNQRDAYNFRMILTNAIKQINSL